MLMVYGGLCIYLFLTLSPVFHIVIPCVIYIQSFA